MNNKRSVRELNFNILMMLNESFERILLEYKRDSREGLIEELLDYNSIEKYFTGIESLGFKKELFSLMVKHIKKIIEINSILSGFKGEHGALDEQAVQFIMPDTVPIPCNDFETVFDHVERGIFNYGIIPVESSTDGVVAQVNDLLFARDVKIVEEIEFPVHYCLLAPPEIDYRDIKVVYSYPGILEQCRGFIERNNLEARPYHDAVGAAKMMSRERPGASGVIAGSLCSEAYDLEIIKENIEDNNRIFTRFLVISKEESSQEGSKCSIIFSTDNKPGALYDVMKIFAEESINLTRLESWPIKDDPSSYVFLIDFNGSSKDDSVREILGKVKLKTSLFKSLGCFKRSSYEDCHSWRR